MGWHACDVALVGALHRREELLELVTRKFVRERVPALRFDALTEHHLHPTGHVEELVLVAHDFPAGTEHLDLFRQRVGNRHGAKHIPERLTFASIGVIMQDDEIADAFHLKGCAAVEIFAVARAEPGYGKVVQQPVDPRLNQMNAGRFKRFEKTR